MEEFAQRRQRVRFRHGAMTVHRAVAKCVDHAGLAEHRLACHVLEARFVDQRREIFLIGQPETRVVLVGPGHRQLQGAAGVEAGRPRIGVNGGLGFGSGVKNR